MIENFTIPEWIAFFFIYSFLGWCVESTIVSVTNKKLVNRGFLMGPMLPLYGFGALTILLSTLWAKDNFILVFVCGMVSSTVLEYVTGVIMESLFKMRYWDYSNKKFNIKGYICLKSSLFWGVLAIIMVEFVHGPIAGVIHSVTPFTLNTIVVVVVCVALADTIQAFKKAFDFKRLLDYQTAIRNEITELSEKIAVAMEVRSELKNEKLEKNEDKQAGSYAKMMERVSKLKDELNTAKEKAGSFSILMRSFPSATSKRFGEALDEFKERFSRD